jgi:hypothetical protein
MFFQDEEATEETGAAPAMPADEGTEETPEETPVA